MVAKLADLETATWPADHVERWPVAKLTPYARNARVHSEAQVAQIAASICEWGWTIPVLADESGQLIAGHGRVLAAQKLGLIELPVMIARGWSEAKKRAYVLADNKLALNSEWDDALLKVELSDLKNIELTGFSADDLVALNEIGKLEFDDPPESVADNAERLRGIRDRRKGNEEVADKRDTERYMVIVFRDRAAREAAMRKLGLPEDERYIDASSVDVRLRFSAAVGVGGRKAKAASRSKSGGGG